MQQLEVAEGKMLIIWQGAGLGQEKEAQQALVIL